MQHLKYCTKNLAVFKFDPTSSNISQEVAKRMQLVVPNSVARCRVEMLRAFGQAFTRAGAVMEDGSHFLLRGHCWLLKGTS